MLLDRYFLSIPSGNRSGVARMHIETKAKMNTVAYEPIPGMVSSRSMSVAVQEAQFFNYDSIIS